MPRIPQRNRISIRLLSLVSLALVSVATGVAAADEAIRFSRDIRPLLSDRCFACHGPDGAKRKAGLRLDSFEEATLDRDGAAAIVPGEPGASLLLERIGHADPDERMPPEKSNKPALTPEQVDLMRRWIEQGAQYEEHWAFTSPQAHEPPAVENEAWCRNEIDRFILARLEAEGINPSPETDRATLTRRLYLDLTGLPPTPEEIQSFEDDPAPDAYEQLVQRLLGEEPYRTR